MGGRAREILVGQQYAFRKKGRGALGDPVNPVFVVKEGPPKSYKYRVRWMDGEYEGLEEWVRREQLLCPWAEAAAVLEDERRFASALAASEGAYESPMWKAAQEVFSVAGAGPFDLGPYVGRRGLLCIDEFPSSLNDVAVDAQELLAEPNAFIDRFGDYWAPFATAERIAKKIALSHAAEALQTSTTQEQALREAVVSGYYTSPWFSDTHYQISRAKAEERLRDTAAVLAVLHSWCGQESVSEFDQVRALRGEVDRLRSLIDDTAGWLVRNAEHHKAPWLKRKATELRRVANQPSTSASEG